MNAGIVFQCNSFQDHLTPSFMTHFLWFVTGYSENSLADEKITAALVIPVIRDGIRRFDCPPVDPFRLLHRCIRLLALDRSPEHAGGDLQCIHLRAAPNTL